MGYVIFTPINLNDTPMKISSSSNFTPFNVLALFNQLKMFLFGIDPDASSTPFM